MISRQGCVTVLDLEKETGAVHRLLVSLDQLVGELAAQRISATLVRTEIGERSVDEAVHYDDDDADQPHAHVCPLVALSVHDDM